MIDASTFTPFPPRGLYVITRDPAEGRSSLIDEVKAAIRGGAVVVQYRAKQGRASVEEARALLKVCRQAFVPLIVNDDVELAIHIGADGVHLGREDPDLRKVRARIGPLAILGVSCYDDLERAVWAAQQGADYVAFGRFFPSITKPNAPCARLETLARARLKIRIPIVAIGGITVENGAKIIAAGADLLAVVEGVFGAQEPKGAASQFQALWRTSSKDGPAFGNPGELG